MLGPPRRHPRTETTSTVIDCDKDLRIYHDEHVTLGRSDQDEMRRRRNDGRTRWKNGLERAGHPQPYDQSSQGSYAMRTMHQDPSNDYDIDDGIYFRRADLVDGAGNPLSPKAARRRIADPLADGRLATPAEVKTNCVRQDYPAGYHIDVPVYRDAPDADEADYELAAGSSWEPSDARAVTRWYENERGRAESRRVGGGAQLSRLIRATKKFARSRGSWKSKTTSGICISRLLVGEVGVAHERLDVALRESWQALETRLAGSTEIVHPVYTDRFLARDADAEVEFFRTKLAWALAVLAVLDDPACSRARARKAWDEVFDTTFFSDRPDPDGDADDGSPSKRAAFVVTSSDVARRRQEERFGQG